MRFFALILLVASIHVIFLNHFFDFFNKNIVSAAIIASTICSIVLIIIPVKRSVWDIDPRLAIPGMVATIFTIILFLDYYGVYKLLTYSNGAVSISALALSASGTLATIGWICAVVINRKSAKTKNSFDVLLQFRNNPRFDIHRANYYNYISLIREPSEDFGNYRYYEGRDEPCLFFDLSNIAELRNQQDNFDYSKCRSENYPVIDSIHYIANFYEFLAISIEMGEIDDTFLKESIRGLFMRFYTQVEYLIMLDRNFDENGVAKADTYEYIYDLARKWRKAEDVVVFIEPAEFVKIKKQFDSDGKKPSSLLSREKNCAHAGTDSSIKLPSGSRQ